MKDIDGPIDPNMEERLEQAKFVAIYRVAETAYINAVKVFGSTPKAFKEGKTDVNILLSGVSSDKRKTIKEQLKSKYRKIIFND